MPCWRAATRWSRCRAAAPPASTGAADVAWDPADGPPPADAFAGADAVVNLAGAPIGGKRWTAERKRLIRESRTLTTRLIVDALARRGRPAHAGQRAARSATTAPPTRRFDESARRASDFLGRHRVAWEREAPRAREHGARVVLIRTGLVLTADGGVLPQVARPVKLFAGGPDRRRPPVDALDPHRRRGRAAAVRARSRRRLRPAERIGPRAGAPARFREGARPGARAPDGGAGSRGRPPPGAGRDGDAGARRPARGARRRPRRRIRRSPIPTSRPPSARSTAERRTSPARIRRTAGDAGPAGQITSSGSDTSSSMGERARGPSPAGDPRGISATAPASPDRAAPPPRSRATRPASRAAPSAASRATSRSVNGVPGALQVSSRSPSSSASRAGPARRQAVPRGDGEHDRGRRERRAVEARRVRRACAPAPGRGRGRAAACDLPGPHLAQRDRQLGAPSRSARDGPVAHRRRRRRARRPRGRCPPRPPPTARARANAASAARERRPARPPAGRPRPAVRRTSRVVRSRRGDAELALELADRLRHRLLAQVAGARRRG